MAYIAKVGKLFQCDVKFGLQPGTRTVLSTVSSVNVQVIYSLKTWATAAVIVPVNFVQPDISYMPKQGQTSKSEQKCTRVKWDHLLQKLEG